MPELALAPHPPRAELLRQVRGRLQELLPEWRPIGERMLGAESPIDFVGLEPSGRVVLVLLGGPGEDLELVGQAIAQRAWVEARLRDWLQLSPNLAIRPEAGVGVLLLCPGFRAAAVAAARALGADSVRLGTYRSVRNGAGTEVLLEPLADGEAPPPAAPRAGAPIGQGGAFRTGLSEADLDLTREELDEFE